MPSSKSISNRALILNALSGSQSNLSNLATARDTKLMKNLLESQGLTLDAMDAGTTIRFLTAYYAISDQHKILTGTARMKERPIALLVEALRQIGASISYREKDGFPPIEINPFGGQRTTSIAVPGNVSSQYISALMMVAPKLPHGLEIQMEGKVGSRPYIEMTCALMKEFGVKVELKDKTIRIPHSTYRGTKFTVEPDWSALSYWLAFTALAEEASLVLKNVPSHSIQGDRTIVGIMEKLGVRSTFHHDQMILEKSSAIETSLDLDFTNYPDLAQTVLPVCALKGIKGTFTGLESLYIKETDRIAALQNELSKVGAKLEETHKDVFELTPGELPNKKIIINTYHDHRMAMGFAPWSTMIDLEVEAPEVVQKSYPEFWDDLRSLGFDIQTVSN